MSESDCLPFLPQPPAEADNVAGGAAVDAERPTRDAADVVTSLGTRAESASDTLGTSQPRDIGPEGADITPPSVRADGIASRVAAADGAGVVIDDERGDSLSDGESLPEEEQLFPGEEAVVAKEASMEEETTAPVSSRWLEKEEAHGEAAPAAGYSALETDHPAASVDSGAVVDTAVTTISTSTTVLEPVAAAPAAALPSFQPLFQVGDVIEARY